MEAATATVPTIRDGFDGTAGDHGTVDSAWSAFQTKIMMLQMATGLGATFDTTKGDDHEHVVAANARSCTSLILSLKGSAQDEAIAIGETHNMTARKLFKALDDKYAPKTKPRAMVLINGINTRGWQPDDTPAKVLTDIRVNVRHLSKFPEADRLPDAAIRLHILNVLPEKEYDTIRLKHVTSTSTWEEILQEAQAMLEARGALGAGSAAVHGAVAATTGSAVGGAAFYGRQATTPGRAGGKPRRDKSTIECYNCHKLGHFQSECRGPGGARAKPAQHSAFMATGHGHGGAGHDHDWIMDSGATTHVTGKRELLQGYEATKGSLILLGKDSDGNTLKAQSHGQGNARVTAVDQHGAIVTLTLLNVAFVPGAPNILSEGRILACGARIVATQKGRRVHLPSGTVLTAHAEGLLHVMHLTPELAQRANTVTIGHSGAAVTDIETLHRRIGHRSAEETREAASKLGIATTGWELLKDCDACRRGKARHQSVGEGPRDRAARVGERIFVDMWGPAPKVSLGGMQRATLFVDDATDLTTVIFSQGKDSVNILDKFIASNVGDNPPLNLEGATIHTDSEAVFTGGPFRQALARHGLKLAVSPPHAHELNGRVERKWGTLLQTTRTLLADAALPPEFWVLGMTHAVNLANNTATGGSDVSRRVAAGGHDLQPDDLRTFGCRAYVVAEDANKLDDRGRMGIYVGYDATSRSHRVFLLDTRKVVNTVHVTFVERLRGIDGKSFFRPIHTDDALAEGDPEPAQPNDDHPAEGEQPYHDQQDHDDQHHDDHEPVLDDAQNDEPALGDVQPDDDHEPAHEEQAIQPVQQPAQGTGAPRRSRRPLVTDNGDTVVVRHVTCVGDDIKPGQHLSPKEALARADAEVWRAGMEKEKAVHMKMETMTPVLRSSLPVGTNILTTKMDLVAKGDGTGKVDRVKARLVIRGFQQIPGVDFTDTFASAASRDTVRTLIASAAAYDWQLRHADFEAAYLHAPLQEDIHVYPPDGWPTHDDRGRELVYKLDKAVYGLRQAAREWRSMLITALTDDHGFKVSQGDDSLLVFLGNDGNVLLFVAVYVDDLLATGPGIVDGAFDAFVKNLRRKFNVKVGEATTFLGINIGRDDKGITIDQRGFTETLLRNAGMLDSRPIAAPMDTGFADGISDEPLGTADTAKVRERLGELMWLATGTRPDIAFTVMRLARGMAAPTEVHRQGVKRVLRYLNGSRDRGIHYTTGCMELVAYADASFATPPDVRSVTGGVVLLAGGAVAWISKKQPVTALSASEAEYVALGDVVRRTVIVASMVSALPGPSPLPVTVFEDNSAAVAMAQADGPTVGNRHVATRAHYARDMHHLGFVRVTKVDGDLNTADIFTKPLPRVRHQGLSAAMMG